MRHLLIVGRDLGRLMPLLIRLQGGFHVTTVAEVDDIVARALATSGQPCQLVIDLRGEERLPRIDELTALRPRVLFLASDIASSLCRRIREHSGLVLGDDEASAVMLATLAAFSEQSRKVERT